MKESKALVYVTRRNIQIDLDRDYNLYTNEVIRDRHHNIQPVRYEKTNDVGSQYDYKRDNLTCTCRNIGSLRRRRDVRYFSSPKQVYAYHERSRSFTDIGIGSVKALLKKKVQRIYLPETDDRGCGSCDLSSDLRRTKQQRTNSYYESKRTSSKCVGGILAYNKGSVMSEKLSPIIQTVSGSTSPQESENRNIEIGSNTVTKVLTNTTTQVDHLIDKEVDNQMDSNDGPTLLEEQSQEDKGKVTIVNSREIRSPNTMKERKCKDLERFSSDSLVQHVHDLENPSDDVENQNIGSEDLMENKLEREYRKIFSTKSKDCKKSSTDRRLPDNKSASILKRRFEALRRGLARKDDSKKCAIISPKMSSQVSIIATSHRDVSINSDPPSLEARSFSNTKMYSPHAFPSIVEHDKSNIFNPQSSYKRAVNRPQRASVSWSKTDEEDSECQGVKGMFKLWGKKFNFEEDNYKTTISKPSFDVPKKTSEKKEELQERPKVAKANAEEKEKRKFFFFKKKTKDEKKEKPFKPKKDVTAGRCEVKEGLMIKIGNVEQVYKTEEKLKSPKPARKIYDEETGLAAWLQRYLAHGIESRNSVKVRWNNKMYGTSSSTVFELMDNVYRDTGIIFRSKSEMTIQSSYYKPYSRRQNVNFAQQNIEAWMIPKTVTNHPQKLPGKIKRESNKAKNESMEVRISDQKWFIDKSKAFSHKIEVVLLSKNLVRCNKKESSEYLRIDIPKGFFVNSSEVSDDNNINKQNQSSDEEVYKIVEYETGSDLKKERNFYKPGNESNNIKVTLSVKSHRNLEPSVLETVIKTPPIHRDVIIQGSKVYIPKRCDVVGVGIITQREMKKPVMTIHQDGLSDDDSEHDLRLHLNKCNFAESYLQEYYRHWAPPNGMDLFSWCVSDSHLRCCSEPSKSSFLNQGDGTKSCPNILEDYQAIVSSCETSQSSCRRITYVEEPYEPEPCANNPRWYQKLKPQKYECGSCNKTEAKVKKDPNKRVLPKDSIEVFKRRKIYAASMKSQWNTCSYGVPCSVPSTDCKAAGLDCTSPKVDCGPGKKPCWKPSEKRPKRSDREAKHVSLPNCEEIKNLLKEQIQEPEGILAFKGAMGNEPKKKPICKLMPEPVCEIPPVACQPECEKMKKPFCQNSKVPCDELVRLKVCKPAPCASPPKPPCSPPPKSPCSSPPRSPCSPPPKPPRSPPPKSPCFPPPKPPCSPPPKPPCSPPPKPPCFPPPKPPCSPPPKPPCSPPPKPPCSPPPKPPCPPPPKPPPKPPCSPPSKQPCFPPPRPPCSSPPRSPCNPPPKPPCSRPKPPKQHKVPCSPPRSPPPCPPLPPPCPFAPPPPSSLKYSKSPPLSCQSTSPESSNPSPQSLASCPPSPPTRPNSPPPCPRPPPSCQIPNPPCCQSPCPCSVPPCPSSPPPCPSSPPNCPSAPLICPHTPQCMPPPCQRTPCKPRRSLFKSRSSSSRKCVRTPPICLNSPPKCSCTHTKRSRSRLKCSPSHINCPNTPTCPPEPCCVQSPLRCPLSPPPCKKSRKKKRKPCSSCCSSSSSPLTPKFFKSRTSPCKTVPKPCCSPTYSVISGVSYSSVNQNDDPVVPYHYSKVHPCPPDYCNRVEKPKYNKIPSPVAMHPCAQCRASYEETHPPNQNQQPNKAGAAYQHPEVSVNRSRCLDSCHGSQGNMLSTAAAKNCQKLSCPNHPSNILPSCQQKMVCPPISPPRTPPKAKSPPPPCPPPPCPPPPCPPAPCPSTPCPAGDTKSKLTGVHLRISPSRKACSPDCPGVPAKHDDTCFNLSSEDKITIRLKKETPSTEEIREGLNIKVQDEDGVTLFERKDYVKNSPDTCDMPKTVLGDVYKNSYVQRIATPMTGHTDSNKEISEDRSNTSIANTIEIQFKVKVTQGDKSTEINIANDDMNKSDIVMTDQHPGKSPQDVFVLKDEGARTHDKSDGKNDINIRIVIKNFKPKSAKSKYEKCDDYCNDFSKQISAKFHSVSTGYSDIEPKKVERVFSIHRATVDLTSSVEKSKAQSRQSEDTMREPATEQEPKKIVVSSRVTEESICVCMAGDRQPRIGNGELQKVHDKVRKMKSYPHDTQEESDAEKRETDSEKPETDFEKAETDDEKPETDTEKPETDVDKLETDTDKPETDAEKLETDIEKLDTDTEKPETDTEKPETDVEKQETDAEKPETDNGKPETDNEKPETDNEKPETDNDKPGTDTDKPGTDTDKLETDTDKPETDADKPETDADKPETDADKPETDTEKPETDTDKIETDTDKLETDTEKHSERKFDTIVSTDTDEQERYEERNTGSLEITKKPRTKEEKKEIMKHVFEKSRDVKKNKFRMKKLRDMLKVILTSDSSEPEEVKMPSTTGNNLAADVTYASLTPNYFRNSDSMNNYYRVENDIAISDRELNKPIVYPTEDNNSDCSKSSSVTSDNYTPPPASGCMCSTVAERLKMASRMCSGGGGCCCSKPKPLVIKSEETCCDMKQDSDEYQDEEDKEPEYVDVETQNSRYLASKVTSTDMLVESSITSNLLRLPIDLQEQAITDSFLKYQETSGKYLKPFQRSFSPSVNHVKQCEMRKLNRNTILSISGEDKIVVVSAKPTRICSEESKVKEYKKKNENNDAVESAEILQSYETKKAVLEIYTERNVTNKGERLVAKLPKFVYDTESQIYNAISTNSYVCKNNIIMMTINR